jgi:hypothetical protein
MERQRGFQVAPLLAERVCQTSQPAHAHSHREVLSLDVRGADSFLVWVTVDRRGDRFHHFGRAIAPCVLRRVAVGNILGHQGERVEPGATTGVGGGVGLRPFPMGTN